MPNSDQEPFGEYAPETPTAAVQPPATEAEPDEVETTKYGIGKPRRIIVRGTVAAHPGPEGQRQ